MTAGRVEIARLATHAEAEGLAFTLDAVGIAAELAPVEGSGNGHGPLWALLVDEADAHRARAVLAEEQGPRPPLVLVPPLPAAPIPPAPPLYWLVGLIVVHVLGWIALEGSGGSESRATLLRFGASFGPRLLTEPWRTVTAVFLHIGAGHLVANMGTLLLLGAAALRTFGVGRFLFLYLGAGVIGNWISFVFAPGPVLKAGASGAILGLLGGLAGLRLRGIRALGTSARFKPWHVAAAVLACYGLLVGVGPADHLAHIGGLLGGVLLGLTLPAPGRWTPRAERWLGLIFGATTAVVAVGAALLAFRVG